MGLPVSLSGQFRLQGEQALAGLQAWADDANRDGGISVGGSGLCCPVSVVYYDDASRVALARQATETLITVDRVDLLFGPYSSVLAQAAAEVAEGHGKLLWNQGGASDYIYQRGYKWVVGVLTPASEYLAGLLPLVRRADPEASTLAILRASSGEFPRAVSSGVERQAAPLGFRVKLLKEYDPSISDFNSILDEVDRVRPDVLVGVGRIQNDLLLAEYLVKRGGALKAVAVVAAPIQQFRDTLKGESEGFIGPSQWEPAGSYPNDYGPTGAEVLASLESRGRQPVPYPVDYPMVQSYAAGLVAQRCVESAGTVEDRALRAKAGTEDFSTFYGRFKIDPATGRQVGRSVVIIQWQQGRKVIVWPPELSQAELVYPRRGQTENVGRANRANEPPRHREQR